MIIIETIVTSSILKVSLAGRVYSLKMNIKIYIEKYDKHEGVMLADFLNPNSYIEFRKLIGSVDQTRNYSEDERTMLFIEGLKFNGGRIPKEGNIYELPDYFYKNIKWSKEPGYTSADIIDIEKNDFSAIISFRGEADYYGESFFNKPIRLYPSKFASSAINCKHTKFIKKFILENKLTNSSDNIKVIVRNVGQGNWNEIYLNKNQIIFYDFGCSMYAKKNILEKQIEKSELLRKNPILIISHWDIDHYHALVACNQKELKGFKNIIFPAARFSQTSKRVFKKIKESTNYCEITSSIKRVSKNRIGLEKIGDCKPLSLFRGEKSSNINKSGLTISVRGKNEAMVLPADHSYRQVFEYMFSDLPEDLRINMVTPHHGGKAGKIKRYFKNSRKLNCSITSTGKNNYGHPKDEVRISLIEIGFKWMRTDYEDEDIEIDL
ncbi:Metal-dependent hydrolase, beta-lactamase superfamily II [Halanaerobium congolense]|nr:Metal-dependent hydrolase, beta-lactamase superfamily II [Halanaerobium congolense]